MSRRLHTRILLARLRAASPIKPKRRVGRIPRPAEPVAIAMSYARALRGSVCERARGAFAAVEAEIIADLVELRRAQGREDSARADAPMIGGGRGAAIGAGRAAQLGEAEAARAGREAMPGVKAFGEDLDAAARLAAKARALIDKAAAAYTNEWRPAALFDVVKQFGKRTSAHQREQLDKQLRAAIGVPLSAIEPASRNRIEEWAAGNVDRIKSIPDLYFDRLRGDVEEAFAAGTHPSTLADLFAERYEMSERQAETVARDQVLKLSANLAHDRMENLGVEWATWRTVRDGRVCEICEAMEGVRFKLSEGADGACGPGTLPGDCHPMDRCWSEPDLTALVDG